MEREGAHFLTWWHCVDGVPSVATRTAARQPLLSGSSARGRRGGTGSLRSAAFSLLPSPGEVRREGGAVLVPNLCFLAEGRGDAVRCSLVSKGEE